LPLDSAERMLGTVERGLGLLAAGLVLVLMVLTTADVTLRYGLNSPVPGSWELSQLLLVGIVFLGLAHTQAVGRHVRVELFLRAAGAAARRRLDLLGLIVGFVVFALIFWVGLRDTWNAWAIGDYTLGSITFPVWPSKLMVPVGSLLLCLRLLVQIVRCLRGQAASDPDPA
jgi:TRAP-type C4-dicarboxylate transport system permease small subunit